MQSNLRGARSAVIRLLPLALFAVSAQGAAIFNITGTSCSSSIGGGPTGAAATSSLVANPLPASGGVQGAVLNGACSDTVGIGGLTLEASMFGNFAGSDMPLPSTLPLEFDFTVSVGTLEVLSWYLDFEINGSYYFLTGDPSVSTNPEHVMGNGSTDALPAGVLGAGDTWSAVLGVDCRFCEGLLTIDLGNSSLRINPSSNATVPEPSTVSLLALGGVLLWFKRRRQGA